VQQILGSAQASSASSNPDKQACLRCNKVAPPSQPASGLCHLFTKNSLPSIEIKLAEGLQCLSLFDERLNG
jgi:hypothetical protein